MPKFQITLSVEADIEVSQDLLDSVLTDDWRSNFYPFYTEEDVIEHITRNYIRGCVMRQLDGFADRPESDVKLETENWQLEYFKKL